MAMLIFFLPSGKSHSADVTQDRQESRRWESSNTRGSGNAEEAPDVSRGVREACLGERRLG